MTEATALPDWVTHDTPCLTDSPYAFEARIFIQAALKLKTSPSNALLKLLAAYNIVHEKRRLEEHPDEEPVAAFQTALMANAKMMDVAGQADCKVSYPHVEAPADEPRDQKTAQHYGNLFSAFDRDAYFEEPVTLLRQRLERNGYDLSKFSQWSALDAGCGNGRYTVGMRKLGMKSVVGIDLSEINIADAKNRMENSDLDGIAYQQATSLDLPFEDNTFDFVFSNGVLHHTPDCAKGVSEIVRVLKRSGVGFLKLIGQPGGIHWDHCEILRAALHDVDYAFAREVFTTMNVPPTLRYLFLDHVFAPINYRYTKAEVADMLEQAGAVNLRWLERGADFDLTERTYQGEPYADIKYGMGEHRFYFEKS